MHGETYGANAETTLRERATANNNKQYLTKSDLVRETLCFAEAKPFQP